VLQEPTKASAQVELEGSLEISTSSVKTEQESTSSNCDLKGTRDTQTFHWFHEPQNWDNLCPPQEVANKKDMAVRHTKLYSSFVRLEELKKLGAKKGEKMSKTTRRNILEEASRVERLVNEYDSCWTEPGWPSAQSLFESSKNLNEKKEPKTMSSLTSSILEVTMKTGSTQEKSRRTQAEVRRTDEFPSPPYQPLCHLRTKFTWPTTIAREALKARTRLQMLQRLTRKVGILDTQPVCNDLTSWRLNQGRFSIP